MKPLLLTLAFLYSGGAMAGESPIAFMLAQQPNVRAVVRSHRTVVGGQVRHERDVSMVDEAARRLGVPVAIARAVLRVESGGNCHARSPAGAVGAMQVMPATARSVGVYGDLTHCATGIEAGIKYLRRIADYHGGILDCAAISLYNRGEAAPRFCTSYGLKVLALAKMDR